MEISQTGNSSGLLDCAGPHHAMAGRSTLLHAPLARSAGPLPLVDLPSVGLPLVVLRHVGLPHADPHPAAAGPLGERGLGPPPHGLGLARPPQLTESHLKGKHF